MRVKQIIVTSLLALGMSLPLCASADNLFLYNFTKSDSTAIINNGFCSSDIGIIIKHDLKIPTEVDEGIVWAACQRHEDDCEGAVYNTSNCSGPKIATIHLNTSTGIIEDKTVVYDSSYTVLANGFQVTLAGGPKLPIG